MIKLAVVVLATLMASTPHVDPGSARAKLKDDQAQVIGQRHLRHAAHASGRVADPVPRILTSYQTVCTDPGANDPAAVGDCQTASFLCGPGGTDRPYAAWVMTAASVPPPGPDDWTNTGWIACRTRGRAAPAIVVTAQQFRQLPIPASRITAQPDPATRDTLINIPTNLLTTQKTTILPTTVLGQAVRVRVTPARYHWQYGDGAKLTTSEPGNRYPHMPTAHIYRQPGTFTVQLTTTFTGEYSVAGGPWQPIDGTAAVDSPTATITAQESRAVLVS